MKENNENELQSRRDFFRNAAKKSLPIIGAVVLAATPNIANAMTNHESESAMQCSNCSGTCYTVCYMSCLDECYWSCLDGCKTTCEGGCRGTCIWGNMY